MEVTIKATLCENDYWDTLYYKIQYKIGFQLFYTDAYSLYVVSSHENVSGFRYKALAIQRLKEYSEGDKLEKAIIEKVKNHIQTTIENNKKIDEFSELVGKMGNVKFKTTIK